MPIGNSRAVEKQDFKEQDLLKGTEEPKSGPIHVQTVALRSFRETLNSMRGRDLKPIVCSQCLGTAQGWQQQKGEEEFGREILLQRSRSALQVLWFLLLLLFFRGQWIAYYSLGQSLDG